MLICRRCGRSYRGEPALCEPCEEYETMLNREIHGTVSVLCLHCGRSFGPQAFDRHKWRLSYRGVSVKGRTRRGP